MTVRYIDVVRELDNSGITATYPTLPVADSLEEVLEKLPAVLALGSNLLDVLLHTSFIMLRRLLRPITLPKSVLSDA